MTNDSLTHISLAIIKNQSSEVLIIQRFKKEKGNDNSVLSWAFPGGKVEIGENYAETAKRELLEETGYHTEIKQEISSRKHPQFPVFVHYYSGALLSSNAVTVDDDEIADVKWVKIAELKNYFSTDLDTKVAEYLNSPSKNNKSS